MCFIRGNECPTVNIFQITWPIQKSLNSNLYIVLPVLTVEFSISYQAFSLHSFSDTIITNIEAIITTKPIVEEISVSQSNKYAKSNRCEYIINK